MSFIESIFNPPKPPPIPPAPKPPDPRSIDSVSQQRAAARGSQARQTVLGGYAGGDANVSRPTLLGG